MMLGNLRAILRQGIDAYLQSLLDEPDDHEPFRLVAELDGPLSREHAVRWLTVTLEAVVENYAEYIDYNSTTTQSDRGEMLYTLLDYLRLRTSYDQVAWKLQPVVQAHEVLVRVGLRHGGRKLAQCRRRADRRHRRRPPQAVHASQPQVWHVAAQHRRAAARAVPAAVAGRSTLCPGASGHGRAARAGPFPERRRPERRRPRPTRRARSAVCKKELPISPARFRGPVSTCRLGWRLCSRRWIGSSRRPPTTRTCPVPNCPSRKFGSPGKKCGGKSGRSTAADRRDYGILEKIPSPSGEG